MHIIIYFILEPGVTKLHILFLFLNLYKVHYQIFLLQLNMNGMEVKQEITLSKFIQNFKISILQTQREFHGNIIWMEQLLLALQTQLLRVWIKHLGNLLILFNPMVLDRTVQIIIQITIQLSHLIAMILNILK